MLGIGILFIPFVFSWFTLRKGHTTLARTVSFVWLAVVVFTMGLEQRIGNTNQPAKIEMQRSDRGRADHIATAQRFRAKIMEFEYAKQLFAGIEPGVTSGVINIQVTNFWFDFKPHQKRQMITMITNNWRQEAGTGSVIVHIYDQTGREVGGNSPLSGVWIEND